MEVTRIGAVLGVAFLPILLCAPRTRQPAVLPHVPDVVHPPVPEVARLDEEFQQLLQATDQDPEVQPGLFQGDMALNNELYDKWRVGIRWDVMPERMWRNNTVPYVISPLYETSDYVTIYKAILTLNYMTCIRFVPWNGKSKDFLLIWPIKYPKGCSRASSQVRCIDIDVSGVYISPIFRMLKRRYIISPGLKPENIWNICWSYVGRFGGAQIVSLQPPDEKGPNCLGNEGRSIHELLHALGIFHEQSRADRDEFIDVHTENVIPEFLVNFNKESLENTTYTFEYDYDSIMHYGQFFFSKEKGQPTITAKKKGVKLGQRRALSKMDCLKINDLYGCLDKSQHHRRKYYTLCNALGI